jgi:hypothetical protein
MTHPGTIAKLLEMLLHCLRNIAKLLAVLPGNTIFSVCSLIRENFIVKTHFYEFSVFSTKKRIIPFKVIFSQMFSPDKRHGVTQRQIS